MSMFPIATSGPVGAGGVSSITFSNIPQTFSHLVIRMVARTNRALNDDQIKMTFNGDTGTNYTYSQLYGNGSGQAAFQVISQGVSGMWQMGGNTQSQLYGAGFAEILDYSSTTKNKTVRMLSGIDWNGGGYIALGGVLWMNTAALTSIQFAPAVGTLIQQYSRIDLYGVGTSFATGV